MPPSLTNPSTSVDEGNSNMLHEFLTSFCFVYVKISRRKRVAIETRRLATLQVGMARLLEVTKQTEVEIFSAVAE